MKKIENRQVAFVADRLEKLQKLVASPLNIEDWARANDTDLFRIGGENPAAILKATVEMVQRYQPAASAYLMRAFVRAGRVDDAISAGKLSGVTCFSDGVVVRLGGDYRHMPTRHALIRFILPKITALCEEENARRKAELDDYISRISGEIIPPDPAQEQAEQKPAQAEEEPQVEIQETAAEEIPEVELPQTLDN